MEHIKLNLIIILSFPILAQCIPELNRVPENHWHDGRSHRSNITIPILTNRSETRKPYSSFFITHVENRTLGQFNNARKPSLDPVDSEMIESRLIKVPTATTVKALTTTQQSTTPPMGTTFSDNVKDQFPMQYLPINANNFSIKTIQSQNELEDVEETFTYQVKRQNRNKIFADQDILKKSLLQLLGTKSQDDSLVENNKLNETNKKLDELEIRVGSYFQRLLDLESNIASGHSAIGELQTKVRINSENYRLNENSTKEIRNTFATDKSRIEGQIQSLSMHLRNMNNTTGEKIQNISLAVKKLNSSVDYISHDVRLNDMKIRFNQKALTTLDKNIQTNNEKVVDLHSSVGSNWAEQTTGCGGVLIGNAGILSYKFRQPYLNNERCIWTIRVNRRQRVMLQMLEDGFQNMSNSDFITITEFTEEMTLVTSSRIEHGNRAQHTFRGPLVFVHFFSDQSISGNGFTLKFHGQGNHSAGDSLNAIRYRHSHLNVESGDVNHPEEKNALYQPNEVTTFVVNPTNTPLRVYLRYTDMEKEENCEYDSVSFYGSVKASFALTKKYCDQQKSYNGESLQSSDGTFIVLFRSDSSTQFKGFQFSWDIV